MNRCMHVVGFGEMPTLCFVAFFAGLGIHDRSLGVCGRAVGRGKGWRGRWGRVGGWSGWGYGGDEGEGGVLGVWVGRLGLYMYVLLYTYVFFLCTCISL